MPHNLKIEFCIAGSGNPIAVIPDHEIEDWLLRSAADHIYTSQELVVLVARVLHKEGKINLISVNDIPVDKYGRMATYPEEMCVLDKMCERMLCSKGEQN